MQLGRDRVMTNKSKSCSIVGLFSSFIMTWLCFRPGIHDIPTWSRPRLCPEGLLCHSRCVTGLCAALSHKPAAQKQREAAGRRGKEAETGAFSLKLVFTWFDQWAIVEKEKQHELVKHISLIWWYILLNTPPISPHPFFYTFTLNIIKDLVAMVARG